MRDLRGRIVSLRTHDALFGPLYADNPVDTIVERVRTAVGLGMLIDGDLLPSEPQLADQLGVAIFTIREALAQLREQGLIETRRGRSGGSIIRRPAGLSASVGTERLQAMASSKVREVADWRAMLSGTSASLAAQRRSPRNVTRLTGYVERMRVAENGRDSRAAFGRFNLEMAAAAQSVMLSEAEVAFHSEHGWMFGLLFDDAAERQHLATDCDAIVLAISRGSHGRARTCAEAHISRLTIAVQRLRLSQISTEGRGR